MIKDRDEDDATTKPYEQLNLNTGVSFTIVLLLLGCAGWLFAIRGDVSLHANQIALAEASIRELRVDANAARDRMYQAQITLEGRLTSIEGLLRDVLNRLAAADRERRPQP